MKTLKTTFVTLLMIIGMTSCEKSDTNSSFDMPGGVDYLNYQIFKIKSTLPTATGSVEFLWKGGDKGGDMGNKPENLLAFFSFNAHEGSKEGSKVKAPKGEIVYLVTKPDLTLHREIKAVITGVHVGVNIDKGKAWFVGVVISDTKGCVGDGNGGHDSGCSGSTGGCGDEADGHDGGCSDGGTDGGGCSDGGTDDGGGCSDGGTGEEGNGSEPGSGSPGGEMGNPLSEKNCRLGQIIAVKVHDKGTPGINDGLTWKWFDPNANFVPSVDNIDDWIHLCKKTIVGGNIAVHY